MAKTQHLLPALAAAAILVSSARAHDTYLLPLTFTAPSPVAISLSSGRKFPILDYGIKKARVAKMAVAGPDPRAGIKASAEGKDALKLLVTAKTPGTYVATVELFPHDIDLKPEEVAEYFAEIDAPPPLRADYNAMPEPRVWRETYTKYAKTVFCVTSCGQADALTRPTGSKLEFVAVAGSLGGANPKFRLLRAGAPLPNAAVAVFRGDGARMVLHTDEQGTMALPSGLTGPILLTSVVIAPPKTKGGRFPSEFATLTFDAAALAAH